MENKKSIYDDFFKFKDNFPRISDSDIVLNYGRFVVLKQSCGSVSLNIPPHIEVKVYENNKLEEIWSGNAEAVMLFASGRKIWKSKQFPDGDFHIATIKFVGDNITLTMKQGNRHYGYKPYYSTPQTVISLAEWGKVIELAKIANALHEEYKKEEIS